MPHTATMFIGVSEGYNSPEAESLTPETARRIVSRAIASLIPGQPDGIVYALYPALAVYRHACGCPPGGEPAGLIACHGDVPLSLALGMGLKEVLKQEKVVLGTYTGTFGRETLGFVAETRGEMQTLAPLWQELEESIFTDYGIDITCGIYHRDTSLVMQAEHNPHKGEDPQLWRACVSALLESLRRGWPENIMLTFRKAGYTSLE